MEHQLRRVLSSMNWVVVWFVFSCCEAAPGPLIRSEFDEPKFNEPISLDFKDVPIRQVLQILAHAAQINLVVSDAVTGNVSVSLTDMPWINAIELILKIKGLDKSFENNVLFIAPIEQFHANTHSPSSQQVSVVSETIEVHYAQAQEMAQLIQSDSSGVLSKQGQVSFDGRTNQLIITDTESAIKQVKALLAKVDVPVKQVLIESRMVTLRENLDEQFGIRWGFTDSTGSAQTAGSLEAIRAGVEAALPDRLNVNLPISRAAGRIGFQVARLVDGRILDLELAAIETENRGEIIANPRITVANRQEAYIEQGTEIPFVQSTSSGATSVEFKKAVLSLRVTPHITPDQTIILDLVVTQDTRGDVVQTSTGPAVAIDTQEVSTQVLVSNNETIVLGGIFQENKTHVVSQVPVLGKVPIVGKLFRSRQTVSEKRELLVFVTPRILGINE